MTTQLVALVRGVNVGRNNRIAMPDLRELLSGLGYVEVTTLLQSGNAVFRANAPAVASAAEDISNAMAVTLGIRAAVVVRTAEQFHAAIDRPPLFEAMTDPARYLVGFLDGDPEPSGVASIGALDAGEDRIEFRGREVYLWLPEGVIASRFSKLDWPRTVGAQVTMRNWATVTKLSALLGR